MLASARSVCTVAPVIGLFCMAAAYAQNGATYSTVSDFNDAGCFRHNSEGIDDGADGSLAIRSSPDVLPYLWVACSGRGTIVRIATSTTDPITGRTGVEPGDVLGEYWAAPQGCSSNPSRTAVDFDGGVWVGNRNTVGTDPQMGHVVKIGSGLVSHQWKDRDFPGENTLGQLDTSTGLGDIKDWPNDGLTCDGCSFTLPAIDEGDVARARDELILLYQPVQPTGVRQVSVSRGYNIWGSGFDNGNNVWVAGTDNHELRMLDGRTGEDMPKYDWDLECPGGAGGA